MRSITYYLVLIFCFMFFYGNDILVGTNISQMFVPTCILFPFLIVNAINCKIVNTNILLTPFSLPFHSNITTL